VYAITSRGFLSDAPGTLHVIDTTTNTVTRARTLGTVLSAIAASPDNHSLYVTDRGFTRTSPTSGRQGPSFIHVVDADTLQVTATVNVGPIGSGLSDVVLSRDGRLAYLTTTEFADAGLSVFDPSSLSVTHALRLFDPFHIALSPDGTTAYVAQTGQLAVVDTNDLSLDAEIRVPRSPRGIAISPDGQLAYVASCCPDLPAITFIETAGNRVVGRVPLGDRDTHPSDVALAPNGHHLLVATEDQQMLIVDIHTRQVVETVPRPGPDWQLRFAVVPPPAS
jgi:DNA-binding beta-propeller fold protein YncE